MLRFRRLASLDEHDGFALEVGEGLSEDQRSRTEANHKDDQTYNDN